MEYIDKYKVVAALVRAFFGAFSAGIVDCLVKDADQKFRPVAVKKAMLNHYEAVGRVFNDMMFYPFARLNYTLGEIEAELHRADMKRTTMVDLVRMACRSEAVYAAMVAEYKRNFTALLAGRMPDVATHLKEYTRGDGESPTVDTDLAIALCVRTTMTAYARGIRQAHTGKSSFHQATLFRLLLEGMATLLHDKPFSLSGISGDNGLNDIFLRACRSERNFAIMTAEMDSTYAELVKSECIIAQDDTAN